MKASATAFEGCERSSRSPIDYLFDDAQTDICAGNASTRSTMPTKNRD
jgi:hypothetical protein